MSGAVLDAADLTSALDDFVTGQGCFPEYISLRPDIHDAVMASTGIGHFFGAENVVLNIWNGVPVRVDHDQVEALRIGMEVRL